jgi:hypothetical protein
VTSPRITQGNTYEMFWDCEYCGTRKLLGLSQRFCPHCGAPQNPDKRYFPLDSEKVAAKDHQYAGADQVCAACNNPNSAKTDYCTQCGAPLSDAAKAKTKNDEIKSPHTAAFVSAAAPLSAPRKKYSRGIIIVVTVLITLALIAFFWKKELSLELQGYAWERNLAIETFRAVTNSAWCDSLPTGAYNISRSRQQRSTQQIPDGESCTLRRVDQGDGSYREQQECTPTYRTEPVYDEFCHYSHNRWVTDRTLTATGTDQNPHWPKVELSRSGTCLGCEREGARTEVYYLYFVDGDGKNHKCDVPPTLWQQASAKSHWKMRKRVFTPGCGDIF